MKQLIQIIALNLLGLNALQIIAAISVVILLLQTAINRIPLTTWRRSRDAKQELEKDLWLID